MKVVLGNRKIFFLLLGVGAFVHADVNKIYPTVRCWASAFHVASDDASLDGKAGKKLTVRGPAGVLATVRSTNLERIAYLLDECHEAVRSGRVSVNTETGEVLPVNGFKRPVIMPSVSIPAVSLSLHPVDRKMKSPNDL